MFGYLSNPAFLRITLVSLAVLAILAAYLAQRVRADRRRQQILRGSRRPPSVPGKKAAGRDPAASEAGLEEEGSTPTEFGPEIWPGVLQPAASLGTRIARGMLILLATVVGVGFILILLPEGTVRTVIQTLQASKAAELPTERIALLYLGDEVRVRDFHIRGILRNISPEPLNQLDATIRLYSPENILLETVIVRMDADTIPADGTTEFHLVYSGYSGQFDSYSVDFKLRQGDRVPYKDRRGERHSK